MPIIVIYICAALLFVGAAPMPYWYYVLMRPFATLVFLVAAYTSHHRGKAIWTWLYVFTALVLNPVFKMHLPREVWMAVDVGAGLLLVATAKILSKDA